jgi:poly(3-hydroxybutyrate) depolymerase
MFNYIVRLEDMVMNYWKGIIIILFMIFTFFTACSSGNKKGKAGDNFEFGKVIPNVVCKNDANITYSLYLPSTYSTEKQFPVIFAFDSHAKGIKPVELFHEQAEKYGYILVGSNNSKNGLNIDESMRIYDILSDDVRTRFHIDQNRMYTAGFSGGSRVASSIAIFKGGICGVIGCSAGFPALSQPIQFKFDYIGFVGDEDMNYLEMLTLEDALQQSGYRHQLVVFKGKHDWPPKESVADAFIWLEANAMKDKKKPADAEFVSLSIKTMQDQAGLLEKQGKTYDAYKLYQKIINFFDGLTDISATKKKLTAIESLPAVSEKINRSKENQKEELRLQTRYIKALGEKNTAWWKEDIKRLNALAENTKNDDERAMTYRLLGYLSLATYSNSNGYLNAGQLDMAAKYIELYSIIDPTNNEHAYLSAVLNVKQGNTEKAFESLKQAISLEFDDYSRYQNDTVLARLKNDTRYFDLLEQIRQVKTNNE